MVPPDGSGAAGNAGRSRTSAALAGSTATLGSFIVTAAGGLTINVVIARHYDQAVLGDFSVALALFVLAGNLASLGLPSAVGKLVAEERSGLLPRHVLGLGWIALGAGLLAAMLLVGIGALVSGRGQHPGLGLASMALAPAVALFGVNRIALFALNGARDLGRLALLTALWSLVLVGAVAVLALRGHAGWQLAWAFGIAEAVLLVANLVAMHRLRWLDLRLPAMGLVAETLRFGLRALPGQMCSQINSRLGVLILALWADRATVGVYSLSAMLADGCFSLVAVLAVAANPEMSFLSASGRRDELMALVRRTRRRLTPWCLAFAAAATLAFPTITAALTGGEAYRSGWGMFALLMVVLGLCGPWLPFAQILMQTGHPSRHSLVQVTAVAIQVALGLALTPWLGLWGVAVSWAASWLVVIIAPVALARRWSRVCEVGPASRDVTGP